MLEQERTQSLNDVAAPAATNCQKTFFGVAAFIVAASLAVRVPMAAQFAWAPMTVLVALSVVLPAVYFACFRAVSVSRRLIRMVFLACLGLWLTGLVVPPQQQALVQGFFVLRYLKWPLVVYLEVQIALVIWRVVFKQKRTMDDAVQEVAASANLPGWAVRLAQLEGRMWKWLWSKATGRNRAAMNTVTAVAPSPIAEDPV